MRSFKIHRCLNFIRSRFTTSKNKLGQDSPFPKFLHLKIRRRNGVESLTTLEEGEFKFAIDGCINVNEQEISSAKGKAEALNQQYCSVFTSENTNHMPKMNGEPFPSIDTLTIDLDGVTKLLQEINPKKAYGPDGIHFQLLKDLSQELAPVICHIFSKSLSTGDLPDDWLTTNITAIFKKGEKCKPSNYRPVSLTSVTCKLIEHIIFRHIMAHLEEHNILSHFQHGFRSGHSCETQLLIKIEDLSRNLHDNKQTDVQILDFQKAFDVVPHQRLLQKLNFLWNTRTTFTVDRKMANNKNAESSCRR